MQITRQTEYAIRTLIELASAQEDELLTTRSIAQRHDIPEVFLFKTIQLLARAGFVVTQRGMQGGIRLARSADKITIADIVTVVEGPMALNVCLVPSHECPRKPTCEVHRILARAQKALVDELSKETLADIVAASRQRNQTDLQGT